MFQYSVRHSPLSIDDLLASITSTNDQEKEACDVEMTGWPWLLVIATEVFLSNAYNKENNIRLSFGNKKNRLLIEKLLINQCKRL